VIGLRFGGRGQTTFDKGRGGLVVILPEANQMLFGVNHMNIGKCAGTLFVLSFATFVVAGTPRKEATADVEALYASARLAARENRPVEALDALDKAMEAGCCPTRALTESDLMSLHAETRFRELIKKHARQSVISMIPGDEPGQKLVVTGQIIRRAGVPVPDALIYVYQTDHRGYYHPDRAFWGEGFGGDQNHARLFGYLKADAKGRFEIRTIRPAGYPDSDMPQHIHVEIEAPGYARRQSEFLFEDDPRLTPAVRGDARRAGYLIAPVEKDGQGGEKVSYTVKLNPAE